ncbi:MAG: hypothetical protein HOW73_27595 [Polyangiaceae bacterium]|nr:hypothetical protein [Polyangiaceae bacterium]
MVIDRRSWLAALIGVLAQSACSSAAPAPAKPPPPPLSLDPLDTLATSADLVWMVRARPRAIAQIPWLIPAIGRIVPEPHFDAFRLRTGLDPRQLHEVLLLRYGAALGDAEAQIVRHNADAVAVEKSFFARLSSDAERIEDHPELVRIAGTIGRTRHAFARLGRDVVAFQQRGDTAKGPVAIASLFARGKLTRAPRLLAEYPLGPLVGRFGDAPVIAAAIGPFTDEWKKAAHGLLEIATAVGAAARPTARENVGIAIALVGAFGQDAAKAAEVFRTAWDEVALSTMGGLLGLDRPVEAPVSAGHEDVVTLSVELEPGRLTEGLKALIEQDIEAIMRLD